MPSEFEALIREMRTNPDQMYVTGDGTKLFVYNADTDEVLMIMGTDLHLKNEEELNRLIQDRILDLYNQRKKA